MQRWLLTGTSTPSSKRAIRSILQPLHRALGTDGRPGEQSGKPGDGGSSATCSGDAVQAQVEGAVRALAARWASARAAWQQAQAPTSEAPSSSSSSSLVPASPSQQQRATGPTARSASGRSVALSRALERVQHASRLLNELTGYSAVEALKEQVTAADEAFSHAKHVAAHRKQVHEEAMGRQMQLQRDLNKLLERKSTWSDEDVERFARLYRQESQLSREVQEAHASFGQAEGEVERAQADYMEAIRERYAEEQLWGDKIRRAATWWTWGLIGLQIVSFLAVVLVVEPRRVTRLQESVRDMLLSHEDKHSKQLEQQLHTRLAQMQQLLEQQRADVVMHTIDGSRALAAGQAADAAGVDATGLPKVDLAKYMEAVVAFMDGVHAELVQHRVMLSRLEANLSLAATGGGPGGALAQGDALPHGGAALGGEGAEAELGRGEGTQGEGEAVGEGGGATLVVFGRRVKAEQAVGAAAAVSAGVGALLGVLLVVALRGGGAGGAGVG